MAVMNPVVDRPQVDLRSGQFLLVIPARETVAVAFAVERVRR